MLRVAREQAHALQGVRQFSKQNILFLLAKYKLPILG